MDKGLVGKNHPPAKVLGLLHVAIEGVPQGPPRVVVVDEKLLNAATASLMRLTGMIKWSLGPVPRAARRQRVRDGVRKPRE